MDWPGPACSDKQKLSGIVSSANRDLAYGIDHIRVDHLIGAVGSEDRVYAQRLCHVLAERFISRFRVQAQPPSPEPIRVEVSYQKIRICNCWTASAPVVAGRSRG